MAVPDPVAVVGSSTVLGRAVLQRLVGTGSRILAVDGTGPDMPPGEVEVRLMEPRDRLLPLAVAGAGAIVHAAHPPASGASAAALFGITVGGTRNVLEAAAEVGARHLVVLSSTVVYGAHDDNPVPMSEAAPMRANPTYAFAYHHQIAEEMVAEWATTNPGMRVTVLRVAPLLLPGVSSAMAGRLAGPRLVVPAGHDALWQFAHPADVAEAVALVLEQEVTGTFNVGSDGWLTTPEVASALRRRRLEVGQTTLESVLARAHEIGLGSMPPEAMPFLVHPVVVDVSALRDRGWRPQRSNRDVLTEFAPSVADRWTFGSVVLTRRVRIAAMGLLGGLLALGGARGRRALQRRRSTRRSRRLLGDGR